MQRGRCRAAKSRYGYPRAEKGRAVSASEATAFQPDLYAYDLENDPVPTLNRLRVEDPVHWSRHGFWFLTRYNDVALVLKDAVRFSSAAAGWGDSNPLASVGSTDVATLEKNLSPTLAASFNQTD